MEEVLSALGWTILVLLAVIGLVAGWLASRLAGGRNAALYMAVGVLVAVAAPFLFAALGLGALIAAGALAVAVAAVALAAVVLLVVRAILR